jgi:hypothetical protein
MLYSHYLEIPGTSKTRLLIFYFALGLENYIACAGGSCTLSLSYA